MKDIWKKARQIFTRASLGIAVSTMPALSQSAFTENGEQLITVEGVKYNLLYMSKDHCEIANIEKRDADRWRALVSNKESEIPVSLTTAVDGKYNLMRGPFFYGDNQASITVYPDYSEEKFELKRGDALWSIAIKARDLRRWCIEHSPKNG